MIISHGRLTIQKVRYTVKTFVSALNHLFDSIQQVDRYRVQIHSSTIIAPLPPQEYAQWQIVGYQLVSKLMLIVNTLEKAPLRRINGRRFRR